jgi:serine/threonine protein kinase/formylglycine-generating enzyme required for sulfatase activity
MATTCFKCGEDNKDGAKYCSQCATDLSNPNVLKCDRTTPALLRAEPVPLEDPLIGKTVGGCVIEAKIGEGGMGSVYRGTQTSLERTVAIKILSPHLARSKSYITRFLRESKIVASMKHPNIVAVHDRGFEGPVYYFIMEYIEGLTVSDIISRHGALPPGDALEVARQAAHALGAAAAKNIIHRDIKPENIMIDRTGLVKVTDFGLVKNTTETTGGITAADDIMGTPSYMSPEQCKGATVDHRGDIYSLGMSLYAMLLGKPAFQAESTHGLLMKQVDERPKPAHEVDSNVPESIWPVLERMLEKKAENRFPDWRSVIDAFDEIQKENPETFKCTGMLHRTPSSRFAGVSDTTPVTLPPAVDRPAFELLDADKTTPIAPPGDTIAETPPRRKWSIFIINLIAAVVIIAAVILVITKPWKKRQASKPDTNAKQEPKKPTEVDRVSENVKNDLENGRFDDALKKIKDMRRKHGDKKNKKTAEKVESTEKMYKEMEPLWRKFHIASNEAQKLANSGDIPTAIKQLQEAAGKSVQPRIRVRFDQVMKPMQHRLQNRFRREYEKARKLALRSKWNDAIKAWQHAKRFAISRNDIATCDNAIALAKQKKVAPAAPRRRKDEPFTKLLADALKAYKQRDIESIKKHLAELSKIKTNAKEVKDLRKKLKLETMALVPGGKTPARGKTTKVPPFYMGVYEVTNLQFAEFIKAGGYQNRKYWSRRGWSWKTRARITAPMFRAMPQFNRPEQPVVGISWYEAEAYCKWLSVTTGKNYRLPTVSDWMRAAAWKQNSKWPWGKETKRPPANVRGGGRMAIRNVGSFPKDKSTAGCLDVIGNVAEWCSKDQKFYACGGSWLLDLGSIKPGAESPVQVTSRSNQIGFRCVMELKKKGKGK